jgi:predicted PhzF superfamily epimerase YddE/YHI9
VKLPLYQLDAFTSRRFGGNPAAVVPLDEWLPDATLQAIAAENNLAETAYVIAKPDVSPLRWFTPAVEVDLCGHATLATAGVLFKYIYPDKDRVAFSTRSGELVVTRRGEWLALDFPSRPGKSIEVTDELAAALGARPREALLARDLLAIFDSEDEVRALRPDFGRLAQIDAFAVIASAPGDSVDFVSRFFAPRQGITEDPVTGSSHCTLTPYWSQRLGKARLTAKQVSERVGDLVCELNGERVIIEGQVVEYLRGEIQIE